GNAQFSEGEYLVASQAFQHAVTLHPFAAEAWNNLAYSLMKQERLNEAAEAAKEAIKRGGPHRAAAKATLLEIEAKRG
ncbi:MAG: tetratricopeptide repeat protein, partial [Geminicoccaceae bacterium]